VARHPHKVDIGECNSLPRNQLNCGNQRTEYLGLKVRVRIVSPQSSLPDLLDQTGFTITPEQYE